MAKTAIDVKNREEGNAIKAALEDPVIRASVVVAGVLKQLPSDRARARVVAYVQDVLAEQNEKAALAT